MPIPARTAFPFSSATGSGTFAPAVDFTAGVQPFGVAIGDFDGDGNVDLAVANLGSDNVSILLGNGGGSFGAAVNYAAGSRPHAVAIGDFNGDGKRDLAVPNQFSNNVSIFLGNGNGTFAAAANFAVGSQPYSLAIGDFNGDSKSDLAVPNGGDNTLSILLGNGNGTFAIATYPVPLSSGPLSIVLGDFNGDGKSDIALGNQNSNDVSIHLGNGDGTFAAPVNYFAGNMPYAVAAGDFDGDGKSDLAVADRLTNTHFDPCGQRRRHVRHRRPAIRSDRSPTRSHRRFQWRRRDRPRGCEQRVEQCHDPLRKRKRFLCDVRPVSGGRRGSRQGSRPAISTVMAHPILPWPTSADLHHDPSG